MAKRGRRSKVSNTLTELELEIMDIVWRLGTCTSSEIIEEYRKGRMLADTTIRTILMNLRKKGYLELVPSVERSYVYTGAVSRESVARGSLRNLLARFFEGSPREAITHLLEAEDLDAAELNAIRDIIDKRSRGIEDDD